MTQGRRESGGEVGVSTGEETLRLAVCELPDGLAPQDVAWHGLLSRVDAMRPQALLLNELPFGVWPAARPCFDQRQAGRVAAVHATGVAALDHLDVPVLFGSTALSGSDRLINEWFVRAAGRYHALHHKLCLPEEPGFHEDSWFKPGSRTFGVFDHGGFRFAFAICSELMVPEVARTLARGGVDVLLVPRASSAAGLERWLTVARATALANACYVASSNRTGGGGAPEPDFGGVGFVIDPAGDILAMTEPTRPLATATLSRQVLALARKTYPMTIHAHLAFEPPRPV